MSPRISTRTTPLVALLTDFGTADHYVAAMKGVMLSHDPGIRILDISHDIEPGRVQAGGYALWAVQEDLPPGTVCIAVVDPGVGTDRDIICAAADGKTWLAPDNGLLDKVLATAKKASIVRVSVNKAARGLPRSVSATFHGRDIFAPLGARLATGTTPEAIGVKRKFQRPPEWRVLRPGTSVQPAIVSIDRFGNIVTNIVVPNAKALRREIRAISVGNVMVSVAVTTFGESPGNTPCIIAGSSGLAEIIVRNGSAAHMLRMNDRTPIRVLWSGDMGQE